MDNDMIKHLPSQRMKAMADEITALRARLAEVEAERDNETIKRAGWELEAKTAQAALATARRDALEEAAMVAYEHFPATQDMESTRVCNALEDVAAAIRALIAQEEPTT